MYQSSLLVLASLPFIIATCYYPNGDVTPADVACSDTTEESACCGQGYACLSNGLCERNNDTLDANSESSYVRGSCTDPTFRSSYCPNYCVDPNLDNISGGGGVAKCPDTTLDEYYCIRADTTDVNCISQQNVLLFPGKAQ
jgi:hypothetical protein